MSKSIKYQVHIRVEYSRVNSSAIRPVGENSKWSIDTQYTMKEVHFFSFNIPFIFSLFAFLFFSFFFLFFLTRYHANGILVPRACLVFMRSAVIKWTYLNSQLETFLGVPFLNDSKYSVMFQRFLVSLVWSRYETTATLSGTFEKKFRRSGNVLLKVIRYRFEGKN